MAEDSDGAGIDHPMANKTFTITTVLVEFYQLYAEGIYNLHIHLQENVVYKKIIVR